LCIPAELLNAPPEGCSRLIQLDGQVMAAGARRSSGYREFKGNDDAYRNDVTALIFILLGAYNADALLNQASGEVNNQRLTVASEMPTIEIASFYVCGHWLGLAVNDVVEAIELTGSARLANAPKQVYGALIYRGDTLPLYNLHAALGLPQPAVDENSCQVVVVRGKNGGNFGILVDGLGEILDAPINDIDNLSNVYVGVASVLASVVKTSLKNAPPEDWYAHANPVIG
jgi:chemotaxis signal transduction protein